MNFLDKYPEILTVEQIAEILRIKINEVYKLTGLVRIRIGEGRGIFRYRKIDLLNYIKSKEEGVINLNENQKTQRNRKMGIPDLLSWEEL